MSSVGWEYKFASGTMLETQYTYLASQPGAISFLSKYAFDYARHSWIASGSVPLPLTFRYAQSTDYRRRHDGRSYWILDGRLTREFASWTWHVGCDNSLAPGIRRCWASICPGAGARPASRSDTEPGLDSDDVPKKGMHSSLLNPQLSVVLRLRLSLSLCDLL